MEFCVPLILNGDFLNDGDCDDNDNDDDNDDSKDNNNKDNHNRDNHNKDNHEKDDKKISCIYIFFKSCIRETLNLLTCADRNTYTKKKSLKLSKKM